MYHHIALTLIPGIGPVLARNLISYCGSAEAVFTARRAHLLKVPGIGEAAADSILHHDIFERVDEEMLFIEKHGIDGISWHDEKYPRRLKQCVDAPLVLFSKGNVDFNMPKVLGVVGTRNASSYGKMICDQLIHDLKDLGVLIVSGLAYGIDIAAHKACVKHDVATVGVVAHGLDRIYPQAHRETAKKMIEHGGLLTEFLSMTNPDRQNFPRRNRIVAGMVDGLIVVETGINGGAVITALLADDYHRDVMAFPGQVHHPYSAGCNKLIKSNRAALVETARDVIEIMGWQDDKIALLNAQRSLFPELDENEQIVYHILAEKSECYIDDLQAQSNLTPGTLAGVLLSMEFKGLILAMAGKRFKLDGVAAISHR